MLKSEAEHIIRRTLEETNAQFSEEQIVALAQMMMKISSRTVEEAIAGWTARRKQPQFYSE